MEGIIYIHGKGGSAHEADHYEPLFPDCDVIGFDYKSQYPWEAKDEFPLFIEEMKKKYSEITLIANSIGAYFSLCSLNLSGIKRAFLISPVVDMEKLICDIMMWANVTEQELSEKKEIETPFGETLSWKYIQYVRKNPVKWSVPTHIIYGENDNLTSFETISNFAEKTKSTLSVMKNGEHWFHTEEQMNFIDNCIKKERYYER